MNISKIKAGWALLTGGVTGIVEYILDQFNDQVLAKINGKESAIMYIKDVQAVSTLVSSILSNHASQLSESKRAAGQAILNSVNELGKSLEDFKISPAELDSIIESVKVAVEAWKNAK